MTRGRLRIFLGAAPGVGKTFAMLEEGHRLAGLGRDVVIAVVETHERRATAALITGVETVPRTTVEHRGIRLMEMDLAAVLARRPQIALVDELAHTNAPGSANEKRWQDVEALLGAGISVLSTVNIQHIESLNDVVEQITGVPQRETIPDAVLRRADQTELVDLTPQALRDRLADGDVYPASRIDAALSNYFRLGNLTALRELALLWLADEVDSALQRYRREHGIDAHWEARERVVVALTGGPEGETLLRRGARIAARSSGGDLLAVHVTSDDGLREVDPHALASQRTLVEQLGGTYHQVIGRSIPEALVAFARGVNATQLVIGVSRRSRLLTFLTGPGIGSTVTRASGDIDVHIVSHAAAGRQRLVLPHTRGALSRERRIAGFVLALVGGPLLTLLLVAVRSTESLTADALAFQLLVVLVALLGGVLPASFAAVLSGITLDFLFVQPLDQLSIARPIHFLALALYVVNGLLVSLVVDQAARRTRTANRSSAESEVLATVAGSVLRGGDALGAIVSRTREAFGLQAVRLQTGDAVLASDGPAQADGVVTTLPVGERAQLVLVGSDIEATDRRVLGVIVTQLDAALEHQNLASSASELAPLAATDRVRSALLAAVGHDLRRPLAVATAAVTALRSRSTKLSAADRASLLGSAEAGLSTLADLVTNLLDVSRVQAGVLAVSLVRVDVDDVLPSVLEELSVAPGGVVLRVPEQVPAVRADAGLLQRVLVNLLANALRYSPESAPPEVGASVFGGSVEIRVVDHGPGVPADRRAGMFEAFQRVGDTDNSAGIGLGLALSRGFTEGMGGSLQAEDTPGGGLTMVVALPIDPVDAGDHVPAAGPAADRERSVERDPETSG